MCPPLVVSLGGWKLTWHNICLLVRNIEESERKKTLAEVERVKLERLLDLRGKQFYAFLSAAQELRQLLKEEEGEKEKERALKERTEMEVDQGRSSNDREEGEEPTQKAMDTS